jgi:cytochrome c
VKTKSTAITAAIPFAICILASVLVHRLPHKTPENGGQPLLEGAEIKQQTKDVLARACANCHSEATRWPWYSNVAPMSWLIEADVKQAREHMNLSRWSRIDPADQRVLLTAIGTVIENHEMPPPRYVLLHSEAKLSPEESALVIEWTHSERRRLREASAISRARE